MKVLFIGGTGIISTACTELAAKRGISVTLLNRGRTAMPVPDGVEIINADIRDEAAVKKAIGKRSFDSVVNWIAFTPSHVEQDIRVFGGRTKQYVFISSASVYEKPPSKYIITEDTPLANPFWEYARQKIECENRLMTEHAGSGFPVTIVRPSYTYGDTKIPLAVGFGGKSYTFVHRLRQGKKIIIPGDGTSLWQMTHNTDFARGFTGLLGHERANGEAFHITSDEVLSWNQIYGAVADAVGAKLIPAHLPSALLVAWDSDLEGTLFGDKVYSLVLDNSKIKRFVPDFKAVVPFREGIKRTIAWMGATPAHAEINEKADAAWDDLIARYANALSAAPEKS